jgi:hypothetical protein
MDRKIALKYLDKSLASKGSRERSDATLGAWERVLGTSCNKKDPFCKGVCLKLKGAKAAVCLTCPVSGNVTLQVVAVPLEALRDRLDEDQPATDGLKVSFFFSFFKINRVNTVYHIILMYFSPALGSLQM